MDQDVSQQTLKGAPSPRRSSRDVTRWRKMVRTPTGEWIWVPLEASQRKLAAWSFWECRRLNSQVKL